MQFHKLGRHKKVKIGLRGVIFLVFSLRASLPLVTSEPECSTVAGLVSACSAFVAYGYPDPFPGSPCCHAIQSLNLRAIADSIQHRRLVCRCFMGLITSYSHNATAIALLPGLCGVSLGFTIDPNTDCNIGH